jgi:hypothetical protein
MSILIGTAAEYVIVKLGLVTDPSLPLDIFKRFIRRRMAKGVQNNLQTFFRDNKDELG